MKFAHMIGYRRSKKDFLGNCFVVYLVAGVNWSIFSKGLGSCLFNLEDMDFICRSTFKFHFVNAYTLVQTVSYLLVLYDA